MIDESTDTFFTRLIAAILIDRPSCVFLAVAVIVGTFFSVVLFRAQDSDEFKFGLYGLVFVMIVMSLYVLHMIDQQMVRDIRASDTTPTEIGEDILEAGDTFELEEELQELGPDPFAVETLSPGERVQSHEFLPQPMILPESNQRSSDAISAGLVAGVIVMPIIFIAAFAIPTTSHQDIEGSTHVMGLMCFITSPVAAFLGAITSVIVTKIARRQIPEDDLYRVGLLTGGVTGTVLGIAAAWLMFSLF